MDSTLLRAGRITHLKIVAVALVAVIAVVTVGIHAKVGRDETAKSLVIRAADPANYAGHDTPTVR